MIFFEYPLTAILITISLTLLAHQAILYTQKLLLKYKNTYIEDLNLGLKDLLLIINPEDVFLIGVLVAFCVGLVSFFLIGNLIFSFVCFVICMFLPKIYLARLKRQRLKLLGIQLIDGLGLVSNALRAGQSLPQSMELLVKEMPAPISQEFGILNKEYVLGVPLGTCLKNLAKRVPTEEFQLFTNSILICGQMGGNLTETFDNIAMVIRERIRLEGKIDSMTAEGRTQGLVLTLMPLFLGLAFYWIEPELISLLFTTIVGRVLLVLIVALDVAAWIITKKIINIDI